MARLVDSKRSLALLALLAASCIAAAFAAEPRAAAAAAHAAAAVEETAAATAAAATAEEQESLQAAASLKSRLMRKKIALFGSTALLAGLVLVGVGLYLRQEPEQTPEDSFVITVKDVKEEEFHSKVVELLLRQIYNFKLEVGERLISIKFEETEGFGDYVKSRSPEELDQIRMQQVDNLLRAIPLGFLAETTKFMSTVKIGPASMVMRMEDVFEPAGEGNAEDETEA
ncbi:hypothetical protein Efla_006215 [Eimeria flavescens]